DQPVPALAGFRLDLALVAEHGPVPAGAGRISGERIDVDATVGLEAHGAVDPGEERVVGADADVVAGVEDGPALAHENRPGPDELPTVALDAAVLGVGVATVAGGALALLVCHGEAFLGVDG